MKLVIILAAAALFGCTTQRHTYGSDYFKAWTGKDVSYTGAKQDTLKALLEIYHFKDPFEIMADTSEENLLSAYMAHTMIIKGYIVKGDSLQYLTWGKHVIDSENFEIFNYKIFAWKDF